MAIFSAIGAVIGAIGTFIGGLGAVGSFLLKTAVGIGLNLLAQAIAGKPKDPVFSINGTLQAGGDIPRSFILGRTATAGSLVWVNTWGKDGDTPNAYLTQVIALSDLPVQSLDEVWVNGEKVTLGSTPHDDYGFPVEEYRKDGKDHLWVNFYDGTQTAADNFLVTRASNSQRQWQSTRVGRGVAYAIVTAKVTKNMFSGIPNFKFVVSGLRLYDPSKDSTVGGVGDHRWAEPETWGGDGDHLPAVQIYNLLRGIEYDGEWFYGLQGMTSARLPTANWIAQINKCRAGTGGPTYRAGGEIPVEAPLANAIEALLTACLGRLSEVGGFYNIYVGEPDAPVASFTDGDILSTEEQSFTPFFGLADTINGIAATYPSPDDGWAVKAAPPLYRTDLEALAGNRRLMADVSLDFVPYAEQVQRLMKSALLEGQRARRHTLVLPPAYWPYAVPGAILSWTSERNGYVNKLFRVDGAVDRASLDVMIDITEVDPADYDWDPDIDYQVPVDGSVGPPMRPQPQPIVDWYAEGSEIKDADGRGRRAAILLTWDNTPDRLDDVIGIEYEVVLDADLSEVTNGRTDMPEVGRLYVSHSILPATRYRVRGRYIPGGERDTLWSGWLLVDTPDVRITDVTAYLDGVGEDVYRTLQELRAEQAELRDRLEQVAAATAEATGKDIELHTVSKRFQNATAVALREMTASIEEIDGELQAQAGIVDAVQASVGEVSAGGLFRVEAQATSAGAQSTIGLIAEASAGAKTHSAGMLIDALSNGKSRVAVYGDQFVVIDPDGAFPPFVVEGGKAWFDEGRIRNLTAENISADKLDAKQILQDGTLITELFSYNTIIGNNHGSFSGVGTFQYDTWYTREEIACPNPNPSYVLVEYQLSATASKPSGSSSFSTTEVRLVRVDAGGSTVLDSITATVSGSGNTNASASTGRKFMIDEGGARDSAYLLQIRNSGANSDIYHNASGHAKLLWWNR